MMPAAQATPLSVGSAIHFLQTCNIPCCVSDAIAYLEERASCATLLQLYQHFFPAEWKQSTAPWFPRPGEAHSPRELEFLELVNKQLFPISDWYLDDNTERLNSIPVVPHDIDWWNCDIEDFALVYQFCISLMGSGFELDEWLERFHFQPDCLLPVEQLDWKKFGTLCKKAPAPLCYLYQAVSVVDHSTECIWIDTNVEMMQWAEWNVETLEWLHTSWLEAQIIWQKVEELDEWLKGDSRRFQEAVSLWNRAKDRTKRKRQKPLALIDVIDISEFEA
jgi:hypothetical protein